MFQLEGLFLVQVIHSIFVNPSVGVLPLGIGEIRHPDYDYEADGFTALTVGFGTKEQAEALKKRIESSPKLLERLVGIKYNELSVALRRAEIEKILAA